MATIYAAALAFRSLALAQESKATREIARVYGIASERIGVELSRLLVEYQRLVREGRAPSAAWLMRTEQALALFRSIGYEIAYASASAESIVRSSQAFQLELATAHTREILGMAEVRDVFRPPTEALEKLVGYLGDGSPLRRLFDKMPALTGAKAEQALIEGVATGTNPRETARAMRSGVNQALDLTRSRALTISRTETMRVHRDASLENYKANAEAVRGWVWLCACDLRSCPSCWAMHGTFHDFREVFGSHPNCRCSPLPQVRGLPALIPEDQAGAARFGRLSEDEQREILGPKKFELYRAGRIRLEDMTVKTYDRDWGPQRHEATIAEALERSGNTRKAA